MQKRCSSDLLQRDRNNFEDFTALAVERGYNPCTIPLTLRPAVDARSKNGLEKIASHKQGLYKLDRLDCHVRQVPGLSRSASLPSDATDFFTYRRINQPQDSCNTSRCRSNRHAFSANGKSRSIHDVPAPHTLREPEPNNQRQCCESSVRQ